MPISLLILCAVSGRLHGIGGIPFSKWPSRIMLVSAITLCGYLLFGLPSLFLAPISLLGFITGHGRFFAMKGANLSDPNPENIEKYFAIPIWNLLKRPLDEPAYSSFCMAAKGLLIGAPLLPFAPVIAIIWPISYNLGWRIGNGTALGEWLTTSFTAIFLYLIQP